MLRHVKFSKRNCCFVFGFPIKCCFVRDLPEDMLLLYVVSFVVFQWNYCLICAFPVGMPFVSGCPHVILASPEGLLPCTWFSNSISSRNIVMF